MIQSYIVLYEVKFHIIFDNYIHLCNIYDPLASIYLF
jgi:hypothetical protein